MSVGKLPDTVKLSRRMLTFFTSRQAYTAQHTKGQGVNCPTFMQITENFHLREFLSSTIYEHYTQYNTFPHISYFETRQLLTNVEYVAHRLQCLRDLLECPIIITSGYRTKDENALVGGVPNSFHMKGMAADIQVKGRRPAIVQKMCSNWSGGMGCYETFTHLDIGDRRRWG